MPLFTFRAKERGRPDFDVTALIQADAIAAVTRYCNLHPSVSLYLRRWPDDKWTDQYEIQRYNLPVEMETPSITAGFHSPGSFTPIWW